MKEVGERDKREPKKELSLSAGTKMCASIDPISNNIPQSKHTKNATTSTFAKDE